MSTQGQSSETTPQPAATPATPAPAPQPQQRQAPTTTTPSQTDKRMTLSSSETLSFGRLDSDYFIVDVVVNVEAQETLATATYQQMLQLTSLDFPITQQNFVRMWKTIILKRVHDVYEMEKHRRADHYLRLNRNLMLPAPLADLLYSLGQWYNDVEGIMYHMVPPTRAADPEPWWTLDNAIFSAWNQTVNRMQHLFQMKEYPSLSDFDARPIYGCSKLIDGQMQSIVARWNKPKPADAFIRFVNDELFAAPIPPDQCHLRMTDRMFTTSIVGEYLRRYCLSSNS